MRTAILIGSLCISDSIKSNWLDTSPTQILILLLLITFIALDVIDFILKLKKAFK